MSLWTASRAVLLAAFMMPSIASPVRAEIVDEIVAWVNGEIITKTDYEEESRTLAEEFARQPASEERDARLANARDQLLMQMIDRKILVHHAQALGYDIDEMGDVFFRQFKDRTMASQGIASEEEFERLMREQGMSEASLKQTLVEMYAPEEVIRFEVTNRISVGDAAIEAFYAENDERFEVPTRVTLREIVLLFDSEQERERRRIQARALRERIAAGEDFAKLAEEFSESGTRETGGFLGELPLGDLADHLKKPAAEIPVGGVSKVLETPFGFQIVQIEDREDAHLQPLDDVRDAIRDYLEGRKYRDELADFLEKARAESEWCVKPKYHSLLSVTPSDSCNTL